MTFIALLLLLILGAPPSQAAEAPEEILKRIETVYGQADDLTAEFVQKTSLEGFGERTSRGRLYLKKERMARWDYRTPKEQRIYVSGKRVVLYDVEGKRAVVQDLSAHPDAEPALGLLSRVDRWRTLYDLRFIPEEADSPQRISFDLIPRKGDRIEKIRVMADRESGLISRLSLYEAEGSRVTFEFSRTRLNTGLKSDLFEFKIPRGVEILELPR